MQPYFNPTRRNMEDDLNIFENGTQPQFLENGRPSNCLENGRRSKYFGKGKINSIL